MNTHSGQVAMSSIRLVGGAAGGAISCSPSSSSMVNPEPSLRFLHLFHINSTPGLERGRRLGSVLGACECAVTPPRWVQSLGWGRSRRRCRLAISGQGLGARGGRRASAEPAAGGE